MRKLATRPDLLVGAVKSNAFELVWWLLDKGAKIGSEIDDHDRSKILREAIYRDDPDIVELLLERGAHLLKNQYGETPLHVAAKYGSADVVKRLLDRGADPSAQDNIRLTPLHIAVRNADIDTAVMLLKHGASLSAVNSKGDTPVHLAARHGSDDILDKLLNYVEQSCDLDLYEWGGDTALHLAIWRNLLDKVAMLLEKGAGLLVTNAFGRTPIHSAAQYGTPELLDMLLGYVKQTCDLDLPDRDGNTALHLAIKVGNTDNAKMLLKKGADFTMLDSYGNSALVMALSSDGEGIRELACLCQDSFAMGRFSIVV